MKLYHLCGKDRNACFSPFGWRVQLFLMHKGLDFQLENTRFSEKNKISHAPRQTIPVLEDGADTLVDSFAIARYLEKQYAEPPLFGGTVAAAQAPLLNRFIDQTLVMGIFPLVVLDIFNVLDEGSKTYFRESREKRFGCSLEEVTQRREENRDKFSRSLEPFRTVLSDSPFLSGDQPFWLDYAAFGSFMWPYVVSDYALLEDKDPVYHWRERMFDLFGGALRDIKRAV